jgi:REP element-mobilizing transposase RayT
MSQSLSRLYLHVVFSTKNRIPFLKDASLRKEMHSYVAGILDNIKCPALLVNGVEDHVHILCRLSRDLSVSELLEESKKQSSKWIKNREAALDDFYWQAGYGAFSVSESRLPELRNYIANQEEHHKKISYQDEFRALCRKHGLELDERYAWD